MKPIPVAFHIGPIQVHTYGIGLALTFWFAFTYFERRLRKNGYRSDWFVGVFLWIILAAVVGARALHVLSNLSYYDHNPDQVLAIWHGGLSSFGGLLFAVPTGLVLTHRSGGRRLQRFPGADLHRATSGPLARWIDPDRLPDWHGHRHGHGAVGDRTHARRAPLARRRRTARLTPRADRRSPVGRGGRRAAPPDTQALAGLAPGPWHT